MRKGAHTNTHTEALDKRVRKERGAAKHAPLHAFADKTAHTQANAHTHTYT